MAIRALTRDETRAIDACALHDYHIPTVVLMENAGRVAAEHLRNRLHPTDRVVITCGPGNNGGDGSVVARHLDAWGYNVHVLWVADPDQLHGDAATQRRILVASDISQSIYTNPDDLQRLLAKTTWIVDALLGTGLTRPVVGILESAIETMNRSKQPVLAIDIPSGLDADSGRPLGITVRATFTTTFVAPKIGFLSPGAQEYTGEVEVVDIGIPGKLLATLNRG